MESTNAFSRQIHGWVIWSHSDWKSGWISLRATPARLMSGERRKTFALGWNGRRFAQGNEIVRLKKYDPDAEHVLRDALARELPKAVH